MASEDVEMRSEERRALVLLGITAVLAAIYAAMETLIWTGAKKMEDFYINFPANSPTPHLTLYVVPILQTLIYTWVLYAIFAFFYFSEDWFTSRNGIAFRKACHAAANALMGVYVIYIIVYVPAIYGLLVWIPSVLVIPYTVGVGFLLAYLLISFLEFATDNKGFYKKMLVGFVESLWHVAEGIGGAIMEGVGWIVEKIKRRKKA